MDLFKEARWSFDYTGAGSVSDDLSIPGPKEELYRRTWYKDIIHKLLFQPLVPRFGVMTESCPFQCIRLLSYRVSPGSEGYDPAALFGDIASMVRRTIMK